MNSEYIQSLAVKNRFNRQDLFRLFCENGYVTGEESLKKKLHSLLNTGAVVRVGRNAYCIPTKNVQQYEYQYSALSNDVAKLIQEKHPFLSFLIFELSQLNEFINHQIAHNVIFVSVENEIMDFVFDTLKEAYPGRVLKNPTPEIFHQYWTEDMIVLIKMVTETPKGKKQKWHTRIENVLVDLISVQLLQESISESEYPIIFEDAFDRYVVDESCLFRYARRRNTDKKIKALITEKTNILLRVG